MMKTLSTRSLLTSALLASLTSAAQAISLAPQYQGVYLDGDGAHSRWVQVQNDWRGPTNGTETWGTGIWGLADQAAVLGLNAGNAAITKTLDTRVDQINFADQAFNTTGQTKWGTTPLAPIFSQAPGEYQDNWAARFTGYISITTPGDYNLGVLYDDGFRFSLTGAGGQSVSLVDDGLNFPDRLGFTENLQLSNGLYAFQLDSYERLEAGVTQLSWLTPNASEWNVIPTQNLFTTPVPEPTTYLMMLAGLGLVAWRINKRG